MTISTTTAVRTSLIALTLILATASSVEALTIYTNRPAWEAAVATLATEDFESEPNTTGNDLFALPYTTVNGVTIDELGSGSVQQFLAAGLVNGTQGPHIRDFTSGISWNPGTSFDAFGFDWILGFETWDVKLGTTSIATLSNNSSGFFGVTEAGPLSEFVLQGAAGAQGGISVDDMAFADSVIPEPCTLALAAIGLLGISCRGRNRRVSVILLSTMALLPLSEARAHTFTVDQGNSPTAGSMQSIQFLGPVGQEFTPTLSSLDVVEIYTQDFGGGSGADLFVNIRDDSITGAILGTSGTTHLPNGHGLLAGLDDNLSHFDFSSSVPLVPGNRYVIELVHAGGDSWAVNSAGGDTYPGGRRILLGEPSTNNFDLNFREGVVPIPEPKSLALAILGMLGLVGYRRKLA